MEPAPNTTVSGSVSIVGQGAGFRTGSTVQFYINGEELGGTIDEAPYSVTLNSVDYPNGNHTIRAIARRYGEEVATSQTLNLRIQNQVVVTDTQAPSVRITSPASGANNLEGIVTISASASDNVRVVGVRFTVNNVQIDSEKLTSPYTVRWNVTNLAHNSSHTLRAIARDPSGNIRTSDPIMVRINSPAPVEVGDFPRMTNNEINPAINLSNAYFTADGSWHPGLDSGALIFEAMDAYSGSTRSDAKLLANLRYIVSTANRDPSGRGGFSAQMEAFYACAVAVASKTPRIWNKVSSADKVKHDLLMKGLTISSAYLSSSTNHYIANRLNNAKAMSGQEDYPRTGSPNFLNGPHAIMIAAATYFGPAQVNSMLNGFNANALTAFRQALVAQNLRNMEKVFRLTATGAPTAAQLISATKNWKSGKFNKGIDDPFGLWVGTVNYAHSKNIMSGINNGAGVVGPGNKIRGRIVSGAAGLPNKGLSGMIHGFAGADASGQRSSAQYAIFDARPSLYALGALIAGGYLDRSNSSTQASLAKMNRGWIDLKYKTDNGYLDYSHAGLKGPNSNWPGNPTRWGIAQNMGLMRVMMAWVNGQ